VGATWPRTPVVVRSVHQSGSDPAGVGCQCNSGPSREVCPGPPQGLMGAESPTLPPRLSPTRKRKVKTKARALVPAIPPPLFPVVRWGPPTAVDSMGPGHIPCARFPPGWNSTMANQPLAFKGARFPPPFFPPGKKGILELRFGNWNCSPFRV